MLYYGTYIRNALQMGEWKSRESQCKHGGISFELAVG